MHKLIRAISFPLVATAHGFLSLACGGGGGDDSPETRTIITITGLPSDVPADVTITGPDGFQRHLTETTALPGLQAGTYTIQAERVSTGVIASATTGHDYDPRPLTQTLDLAGLDPLPIAYSVAAELSTDQVVNPGLSDLWSYIKHALPGTTFAWALSAGTIQSSGTHLYGLKWTAPPNIPTSGTLAISCATTDTYGVRKTFSQTVWVVPPLQAPPNAYYGSGVSGDTLANLVVGGPSENQLDFRFRSHHTGSLIGLRKTLKWNSPLRTGYSGGTGGRLRFELYADDGSPDHHPTGKPLASVDYLDPVGAGETYPLLHFPDPPALASSKLYHLLVRNTDPAPAVNYVSTNEIATCSALVPAQPTLYDGDWAVAYKGDGEDWTLRSGYLPSLELRFSDGYVQGKGIIGAWYFAPEVISGARSVREVFTVSGSDRTVDAVYVRLKRVYGTGPLTLRLEDDAGMLIAAVTVPYTSTPKAHHWVGGLLPNPCVLARGATYHLALRAPADSRYEAFPIQDGTVAAGFDARTAFSDGQAQYDPGSGWTGWTPYTTTPYADGDLQFYFRVVP